MKKNLSLPKMKLNDISQRLNVLKAKGKSRLQFPTKIPSKKHYFEYHQDQVVIGTQRSQPILQKKLPIRNTMDISDIEGTRPRILQKQKNVMNYYKNNNHQYNPFLPLTNRVERSVSEPKMLNQQIHTNRQHSDSLDAFKKQMEQRLLINPNTKRQVTEPPLDSYHYDMVAKKLNTESKDTFVHNSNFFREKKSNIYQRKPIALNPTFLSNVMLF